MSSSINSQIRYGFDKVSSTYCIVDFLKTFAGYWSLVFVYQGKKKERKSNIKETIATKVKLFGCKSFLFSSIKDKYFSEEYQN